MHLASISAPVWAAILGFTGFGVVLWIFDRQRRDALPTSTPTEDEPTQPPKNCGLSIQTSRTTSCAADEAAVEADELQVGAELGLDLFGDDVGVPALHHLGDEQRELLLETRQDRLGDVAQPHVEAFEQPLVGTATRYDAPRENGVFTKR